MRLSVCLCLTILNKMLLSELITLIHNDLKGKVEAPLETGLLLITFGLQKPKTWILAHPEFLVNSEALASIKQFTLRLLKGEPLPYITNQQEFYGLPFIVSPAVLIPRPETELLVENAIKWLKANPQARSVLDVGTGSGCIAITLAKTFSELIFTAIDISLDALKIAKINAERNDVMQHINFLESDLLFSVDGNFDVMCANLPYIPTSKLRQVNSLAYEPRLALDGGEDGLLLIRKLLLQAAGHINSPGLILLEIEESTVEAAIEVAKQTFPDAAIVLQRDLADKERLISISL